MHRELRLLTAAAIAVVVAAAAPSARAQGVTGSAVTGTISAEGLGPISGAEVRLRNTATGDSYTAVTGTDGSFFIDNVTPGGPYTLTASAEAYQGYKSQTKTGIQAALGVRVSVDLELALELAEAEQIIITERIDPLQDQGRNGPSTTVNERSINELPLQGRNFTDLVVTAPQVSGFAGGVSAGGQNNRYNNIQIDGGANNDLFGLAESGTPGGQARAKPISIEAVREFQVQIAPFDVRQGNFVGGLVNAVTRSGTNEFRGSLFTYYQSKGLVGDRDHDENDPNTFADDLLDYSTWQLGATLGGPIIKDKAHFFVSADLQEREESFGNSNQITSAADSVQRAGFTLQDVTDFQNALANYGITNVGDAFAPKLKIPDRNLFVKVSTSVIPASRLELTYNLVDASQDTLIRAPTSPSIPGRLRDGYQLSNSGYDQANTTNTFRLKLTSNFLDGKLSNEFLASASIVRDERALPQRVPLILVKVGRLGSSDSWLAAGAERFSHANLLDQDIFQIQDNVTLGLGRHRITVGTSNEFLDIRNVFFQASLGVWAFNSLEDFRNGTAAAYQRRFGLTDQQEPGTASFNVAQLGFYVQDEWSILKTLNITAGVRIDVPFLSDAVTNEALLTAALPIDTGEVPSGNLLWSPRIGFNWDIDGSADTIVRGGTGIFTGRPPYVWVSNAYSVNGLSQVELTCTGMNVPAFNPSADEAPTTCADGMGPTAGSNQGEIDYFDPDTKYPQNWRIALGVDRRLPFGLVGTVDFLYTQDINGWYTTDANLVRQDADSAEGRALYGTFGTGTSFSASPARVDPMTLRQGVKVYNKNGGKVYNATVQLARPFFKDYEVSVAYTWSRSQDLISLTSSQAFSNFQFSPVDGPLEDRNARPSAFDRTHKITVSGTARLPLGFSAGLIYVGQSGTPYTWMVNGDVNADGVSGNDIAFIPASRDQITLRDIPATMTAPAVTADEQYAALEEFVDSQDCLKSARGRIVERGECRNPFSHIVNLRLGWGKDTVTGQRLELQFDIFNLMNLLNSDWGLFDRAAQFENHNQQILRAVGYDTANSRPIYTFARPTVVEAPVFNATSSRWRIQLGARYTF